VDFPVFDVPLIGGRLFIALVGVVHVLISHGCAVGGSLFLVLLEYKSIKENDERLNELCYRLTRWFFILTTSLGALSGVGIWFTTNMFSPEGIGSLLRIFFWPWFVEWNVFIVELALVAIYYLSWHKMKPDKHVKVGIAYFVVSFQTVAVIVGILGFQLTPGKWTVDRAFWDGFFNPSYFPQLFSRTALAGLLAAAFSLFIFAFMRSMQDVRKPFLRFTGGYLLAVSPVYLFATVGYYHIIPQRAEEFISVALVTLQFQRYVEWSKGFYFAIVGFMLLAGLLMFYARRTFGVLAVLPMLLMILAVIQFERVREFSRKPFVINEYMYSNGKRKAEAAFLSEVGVSRFATWAWRGLDPVSETALGEVVFRADCMACHEQVGVNGVFAKPLVTTEEAVVNFLSNMQYTHPFMPPFIGTEKEKKALAKFLVEGKRKWLESQ
jgi:cytochrome bd-type quinol oxidase subunit 1